MDGRDALLGDDAICSERRFERIAYALIVALTLFRILYAAIAPLDLIHDEAYYWDWSRRLDWGYYSKPPLIAWIIAASTRLFGSSTFTVRLPAAVLSGAALAGMYALGSRMYGRRAGLIAVALSAAAPGAVAVGLIMTIDAPLLCFWTWSLYFLWRMIEPGPLSTGGKGVFPAAGPWISLAGAVGCTGLAVLSKQTALALIPLFGTFLLLSPQRRRLLIGLRFGTWVAGSLLFLAPVVIWNLRHDWITLAHTRHHFAQESLTVLGRLARFGEYLLGQGGVVSPLTAVLLAILMPVALWRLRRLEDRERFLVIFGLGPLAGVMALALTRHVEPNWPAPFYVAAIALLAGWARRAVGISPRVDWLRFAVRPAIVGGSLLAAATYAAPFALGWWGLHGSPFDPTFRMRGWRDVGRETAARLCGESVHWLVVQDRAATAELAFYLPGQPRVALYNPSGIVASQYDLWAMTAPANASPKPTIVVTRHGAAPPTELADALGGLTPYANVEHPLGGKRRLAFTLWRTGGEPAHLARTHQGPKAPCPR